MLRKYKDFFLIITFVIIVVSLFIFPLEIKNQISLALNVFITILFPTFFPMFLFTNLLIEYNAIKIITNYLKYFTEKVFHINPNCGYIILISLISGFPSGAKNIMSLLNKKLISIDEANYLLTFTHFSNPLFILNVVNIVLNNKLICYKILISHFLTNFIIAFILRPKIYNKNNLEINHTNNTNSFSINLNKSLKNTYEVLLIILGSTIFCFIIYSLIINFFHSSKLSKIIISGLFDLTLGITTLKNMNISLFIKSILILIFINFGSISVHLQVSSILDKNVKYKNFFLSRIFSIFISLPLFIIM